MKIHVDQIHSRAVNIDVQSDDAVVISIHFPTAQVPSQQICHLLHLHFDVQTEHEIPLIVMFLTILLVRNII